MKKKRFRIFIAILVGILLLLGGVLCLFVQDERMLLLLALTAVVYVVYVYKLIKSLKKTKEKKPESPLLRR